MRKEARRQNAILMDWKDRFIASYDVELQDFIAAAAKGTAAGPTSWDGYVAANSADAASPPRRRRGPSCRSRCRRVRRSTPEARR